MRPACVRFANYAPSATVTAPSRNKYSTTCTILTSRIYLGEVLHNHQWFKGFHEPLVTPEIFGAAQRAVLQGVQPSRDVLSGRVRCGLCGRRVAIQQNGKGSVHYSCRQRGQGCDQPVRSTRGLARGALLGMTLLGHDEQLQAAIRVRLFGGPVGARERTTDPPGDAPRDAGDT